MNQKLDAICREVQKALTGKQAIVEKALMALPSLVMCFVRGFLLNGAAVIPLMPLSEFYSTDAGTP